MKVVLLTVLIATLSIGCAATSPRIRAAELRKQAATETGSARVALEERAQQYESIDKPHTATGYRSACEEAIRLRRLAQYDTGITQATLNGRAAALEELCAQERMKNYEGLRKYEERKRQ